MADKAQAERLKAALRENLKRRKAQARGREAGAEPDAATEGPEPASGPTVPPDPGSKQGR